MKIQNGTKKNRQKGVANPVIAGKLGFAA